MFYPAGYTYERRLRTSGWLQLHHPLKITLIN